jgi:excisionase family DNA binding protein
MKNQSESGDAVGKLLLKVPEACAAMGIGRTILYGLCKVGTIRSVRIGTRGVRIPVSEVQRFIQERMEGIGS